MRGAVVAALTVGFAGCADPGGAFQQRLYLNQPMTGQQRLNGPGYQMTFGRSVTGEALELPTSLMIADTDEALASAPCPGESLAGIALYPATRALGQADGSSTFRVTQEGAAVVQVAIAFDLPYSCNSVTEHLVGTTTYTFFPSNRIVRHDAIQQSSSSAMLTNPAGCRCNTTFTPNEFFFTSYWRFNAPRMVNLAGDTVMGFGSPAQTCAQIGANLIAISWPGQTSSRVQQPNMQDAPASVHDFYTSQTLPNMAVEVTSELNIGYNLSETQCAQAHGNLVRNPIIVDGVPIEMNEHGLYVDTRVHTGGEFEIRAEDGEIPPFGIILDIGTAKHASVSRSQGAYAIQEIPGSTAYLFYFDDGMGMNDSILIEPY